MMLASNRSLLLAFPSLVLGAQLFVTHYSGTVNLLTHSGSSLTLDASVRACGNTPSWLTWDSAAKKLYCTDETGSGSATLSDMTIGSDGKSISLGTTANAPTGGVASALYGGSSGNGFIAIAHYSSSQLSTFKLPLSASSQPQQNFKFTGKGPNSQRQEAPHPHGVTVDPTGAFLVVPDLGTDLLRIYSIDKSSGTLNECPAQSASAGSGPRHAAFWTPGTSARLRERQSTGTMLYVVHELGNIVTAWSVTYSGSCPKLQLTQTLTPYAGNKAAPSGAAAGEVRVKGGNVYVSNRNDKSFNPNDSISSFSLDSSGKMSFSSLTSAYGTYPRTFAINKAGDLVAIGDQSTSNVAIVNRDTKTGALGDQVATLRVGNTGTPGQGDGLSSVVWVE